jgi:putative flavoprotein involved in K+ transport
VLDQRIESDGRSDARAPAAVAAARRQRRAQRRSTSTRAAQGVEVCGRLAGIRGTRALFSGSLHNVCALADLKMNRLLDAFDAWAREQGLDGEVGDVQALPRDRGRAIAAARRRARRDVRTIVWATGYRPD